AGAHRIAPARALARPNLARAKLPARIASHPRALSLVRTWPGPSCRRASHRTRARSRSSELGPGQVAGAHRIAPARPTARPNLARAKLPALVAPARPTARPNLARAKSPARVDPSRVGAP